MSTNSLRVRLILLIFAALLPVLALTLYTSWEQRRVAAREAKKEALRVARLGAATQERLIEGTRQLLITLSQLPQLRGNNPAAASTLLANIKTQYENEQNKETGLRELYANFGVIELNGNMFASAVPMSGGINVGDRGYIQRTLKENVFAIGNYQIGRITGEVTLNVAYPIRNQQGEIFRIIYAALDLQWLNKLPERAELPREAVMTVYDQDGIILARYPDAEQWIGKAAANTEVGSILSNPPRELTTEIKGMDGITRLYAFTPLKKTKEVWHATLAIGIPTDVAFAEAHRILKRNLTLIVLFLLISTIAAILFAQALILNPVNALVKATRRLAAGRLDARTGIKEGNGELNFLAKSFDDMVASIQHKIAERQGAEAALRSLNEELEHRVDERTHELQEKNQELEEDLKMAREIQQAILPHHYPTLPPGVPETESAIRFHHRYCPTSSVGGDFFNVLALSETEAGIFICDVMGHGVQSALITAMIRALVEEIIPAKPDPGKLLTQLNKDLATILEQAGSPFFTTAFYMTIDVTTGKACYANAGHPNPFLLHRNHGIVEPVQKPNGKAGPALGLFEDTIYSTACLNIEEHDMVMLFTDGIFEVENLHGEIYSQEMLLQAVQQKVHLNAPELFQQLLDEIQSFAGYKDFEDDVCLVAVEVDHILKAEQHTERMETVLVK